MGNLIGIETMTQEQEFEELNRAYRELEHERLHPRQLDFPRECYLYTVDFGQAFITAKRVDYGAGWARLFEVSGGNDAKPMVTSSEEQAYRWADYRNRFSAREMYRVMEENEDW
jgi:hypothetical protein